MIAHVGGNPPGPDAAPHQALAAFYSPYGGIDLNDTEGQRPQYDLDELSDRLADTAAQWVPQYFKRGKIDKRGNELRVANIKGDVPKHEGSCVIQLKGAEAGSWYDYSTGKGGQPLSTLSEVTGLRGWQLFQEAAKIVGASPKTEANGHDRPRKADEDRAREINFILQHCEPATGSLVDTYLASRGLYLPTDVSDLRYHPDLTDYSVNIGRPAIVAIIRDPVTGEPTGGIHRTYLADDGTAKADTEKPKMMLGPSAGVVMLMPMTEDGTLGIGEGIESSLAGSKLFDVAAWAALSAGGMKNFAFPPGLKRLLIFADRGTDGENAAADLCRRAIAAGIDAWVYLPRGDDDFADDLAGGECRAGDYQRVRPNDEQLPIDEPPTTPEPEPSPWQRPSLEVILFRDIQARIEDRTIVEDLLNEREMTAAVGASGTAKTFFAVDLALHVAAGREWFGRRTRSMGVIYIAAEAGRGIENRVAAYKLHYPDIPDDLPFGIVVSPVNLREKYGDSGLMDVLDAIRAAEADLGLPVGLIIVDTLSRSMAGGDENSSEDMGDFVKNMDDLRDKTGAHIMIVHHVGKDASRGARGHSLFHAAVDTEITVTRDNATGISTATVTKQRELPTTGQINYRLLSVELGRDQNGRPVTSCVVEPADEPELGSGKSKAKLPASQRCALDLLIDATAREGQMPPPSEYIPAGKMCVLESYWRSRCYAGQVSDSNNQDAKQKAFKRSAEALIAVGRVGKCGDWVWAV